MLHLRVHGLGEVIRVLPCFLPLLEYLLPSFLQVTREREREAVFVEEEKPLDPRVVSWTSRRGGASIRVNPPPRGSRIEARGWGPTCGVRSRVERERGIWEGAATRIT